MDGWAIISWRSGFQRRSGAGWRGRLASKEQRIEKKEKHRTSNIEHRTSNASATAESPNRWMLDVDVGCSMFSSTYPSPIHPVLIFRLPESPWPIGSGVGISEKPRAASPLFRDIWISPLPSPALLLSVRASPAPCRRSRRSSSPRRRRRGLRASGIRPLSCSSLSPSCLFDRRQAAAACGHLADVGPPFGDGLSTISRVLGVCAGRVQFGCAPEITCCPLPFAQCAAMESSALSTAFVRSPQIHAAAPRPRPRPRASSAYRFPPARRRQFQRPGRPAAPASRPAAADGLAGGDFFNSAVPVEAGVPEMYRAGGWNPRVLHRERLLQKHLGIEPLSFVQLPRAGIESVPRARGSRLLRRTGMSV